MNRNLPASLAPLVHVDGEWARCNACNDAFWGMANVTAVVRAKAERHAHKAHAALAGGRPQRRNAAQAPGALVTDAGLQALAEAAYKAALAGALGSELGRGCFRRGYSVGGATYVIKVAAGDDGRKCNLAEAATWRTAPADKRALLCPVVAVSPRGEWVMMRYAERVGQLRWDITDRVEDALRGFVADVHGGNVGLVDGRPVCTDYAAGNGRQGQAVRW